jgi:nucleoside-diphosphate-sugar epimerase
VGAVTQPAFTLPGDDLEHVCSSVGPSWNELKNQNIFLTGGTGFFGMWLLESLLWANEHLGLNVSATVLTRHPELFRQKAPHLARHPTIKLCAGDVCSFEYPSAEFSHVIHAAATTGAELSEENPLLMFDSIVEGTRRVLDFARSSGARRFLFTSSGAVYGRQPSDLTHVSEEYQGSPNPMDHRSAYGEGKRAAEQLCALYARQFDLSIEIARCFAFVGPYLPLDAHFAIGNFIRNTLRREPIHIKGDGTPYRSYLYAADLAIWLWTILFRGEPGVAYNVGSDQELTILQLANEVARLSDPPSEVVVQQAADANKPAERYVPDVDRARRDLKLDVSIDLREAIRRTINFHRQNASL